VVNRIWTVFGVVLCLAVGVQAANFADYAPYLGGPGSDTSGAMSVNAANDNAPLGPLEGINNGSGMIDGVEHQLGGFQGVPEGGGGYWLAENTATPNGNHPQSPFTAGLHPGTKATGGTWVRFDFNDPFSLRDMWVWPYGGCCGRSMNEVVVEVSATGGSDPSEWTTVYDGQFAHSQDTSGDSVLPAGFVPWATGAEGEAVNYVGGLGFPISALPNYAGGLDGTNISSVVITADELSNFVSGGSGNTGLAEVRFYSTEWVVPEPATIGLLGLGGLALIARRRRA